MSAFQPSVCAERSCSRPSATTGIFLGPEKHLARKPREGVPSFQTGTGPLQVVSVSRSAPWERMIFLSSGSAWDGKTYLKQVVPGGKTNNRTGEGGWGCCSLGCHTPLTRPGHRAVCVPTSVSTPQYTPRIRSLTTPFQPTIPTHTYIHTQTT